MKKIVTLVACLLLMVSLTGCASMLKSMGGVSKADLEAQRSAIDTKINSLGIDLTDTKTNLNTKIATISEAQTRTETAIKEVEGIKASIAKLSADLEAMKLTTEELKKAKADLEALSARVSNLSDETLLKLAQLIQNAIAAPAGKEAPAVTAPPPEAAPVAPPAVETPAVVETK
ncbi:MAG: hypothetical protein Q8O15_06110 [Rectinemataceae bacterium]|nr:hypothetical protein [Rectinemataceae bacterium]